MQILDSLSDMSIYGTHNHGYGYQVTVKACDLLFYLFKYFKDTRKKNHLNLKRIHCIWEQKPNAKKWHDMFHDMKQ